MKKVFGIITVAALLLGTASCTEQIVTRNLGGKMDVKLPKGEKLMMATWKNTSLFYLTEPMDSGYVPKKKKFCENSGYGVMETEITFIESK